MKQSKVGTWLPVFSGFYGTMWDSDSDAERELENMNAWREEKGLPTVSYDDVEWDYAGYQSGVCGHVTHHVVAALKKLGCVNAGKFQELRSPREYNFANDSINVEFTIATKNVKAIAAYLAGNSDAFAKYLRDKYTSRSGFMSFHSNELGAWTGAHLGPALADGHKLGSILQFILLNENGDDYEMDIFENAKGNGCYLTGEVKQS